MGRLKGLLWFCVFGVLFAGTLWILNAVPLLLKQEGFRSLKNIGETQAYLGTRLSLPRYFSPGLVWPPSAILAQRKPFPAYVVRFKKRGEDGVSLVLSMSPVRHPLSGFHIEPAMGLRRMRVKLTDQSAELVIGRLRSGERCCLLSWVQAAKRWTLSGVLPPSEILKMAESMDLP